MWIQEKAVKEVVEFRKVAGTVNPADLGTKHLERESIQRHMRSWALEEKAGRPKIAPGERQWGAQGADDELDSKKGQMRTGLHLLRVVRGGKFGPWGGDGDLPPICGRKGGGCAGGLMGGRGGLAICGGVGGRRKRWRGGYDDGGARGAKFTRSAFVVVVAVHRADPSLPQFTGV